MRLWHKELVPVLPNQHLKEQWADCCAIAKNLAQTGKPGDPMVAPMMRYRLTHFAFYSRMVYQTMLSRGYNPKWETLDKWLVPAMEQQHGSYFTKPNVPQTMEDVFRLWHNDRYFRQCFFPLEEQMDRGLIPIEEFRPMADMVFELIATQKRFKK